MEMKNMKMSKMESKESSMPAEIETPRYPYGLSISLENDAIDKLGIETLPKVGDSVMVMARAKVESVSVSEQTGGEKNRCVRLQITDLAVEEEKTLDIKKSLYGA